jgi:23S rRNA pseudouridine2457 synthase
MYRYFIINKPFRVLSQFSSTESKQTLKDIVKVPSDVYPVGRLDYDSEGALILTNDNAINNRLLNPRHTHEREYWVQVEGLINAEAVRELCSGVVINVDGRAYKTKNCKAKIFNEPPEVPDRDPPIRFRKNIPTSWLSLVLTEGKNRQVRKMTAKVGFPTLRLIRFRIEKITINGLGPGEMRELDKAEMYRLLFDDTGRK